ncbi:zinc finger protein ZFP2-like [Bicyclus anynana]|uniref:Zinc finger protein ZFP2-like n=1 Tax=Bicyclus anynana TaxID=110368 RepID=A0ABM3M4E3_BICAN|nr:zinc finger protein ZFP2-like [Bicyclus anynana]
MEDFNEVTLKNVCCTCLSTDRTLSQLCRTHDGVNNLFLLLSHNSEANEAIFVTDVTQLYICWECSAKMQRFTRFRNQACIAQTKLTDISDGKVTYSKIKCLSTLSRCHRSDSFDESPIKEEPPENFVDCGTHIEDIKNEYEPSALSTNLNNCMDEQDLLVFNPDLNNGVEIKVETQSQINVDFSTNKVKNRKTKTNKIVKDNEVPLENMYNSESECSNDSEKVLYSDGGVTRNNKMESNNKHLKKRKANKIIKSNKISSGNIYRSGGKISNNAEKDSLNSEGKVTRNNKMKGKHKTILRNTKSNKIVNSNEVLSGKINRNSGDISDDNAEEDLFNGEGREVDDTTDISDDSLDSVDSAEAKIPNKRKSNNSAYYVSIPIANADTNENEIGIKIKNENSEDHKKNKITNHCDTISKCFNFLQMSEKNMLESIKSRKLDEVYVNALNKCESCIEVFENCDTLEKHISDFHVQKPNHALCKICKVYVPNKDLNDHRMDHYYRLQCCSCREMFYNTNSLATHMKCKHLMQQAYVVEQMNTIRYIKDTMKVYILNKKKMKDKASDTRKLKVLLDDPKGPGFACDQCNMYFKSVNLRHLHVQKQHRDGYQCTTCGKRFSYSASLRRHEIAQCNPPPREQCSVCGKMVRADLARAHARQHANRGAFACVACDKKFASRGAYESHLKCSRTHTNRDPLKHKCTACGKDYRSPGALRDHINYTHMGKTHHKCPICDKALATRRCVTRHIKRKHQGVKENSRDKICQTCGKGFTSTKSLREHELRHTGERPLSCDICSRTFRQKASLYTHKRRVHKMALKTKPIHYTEDIVVLNTEINKNND